MISAVTEALSNLIGLFNLLIQGMFPSSVSHPDVPDTYNIPWLGTAILIMCAVTVVFFGLKLIKNIVWGR